MRHFRWLLTASSHESKNGDMSNRAFPFFQYLSETLGVRYIPKVTLTTSAGSHGPESHIIWQKPSYHPQVIFYNQDSQTQISNPALQQMFEKIVQALGFRMGDIWYADSHGRSFMDFLNWLKSQNLVAPLVVMTTEPDIQNQVQNVGAFNWVECFSLNAMNEKTSLKKPTWEILKRLTEKK